MLTNLDLEKIKERIINKIDPLRIYLFGSYAGSKAGEESDLDLFIEVEDDKDIFEIKRNLNRLFIDRIIPMDFLVENKSLVKKNTNNKASFYYSVIKDKAKLLYER